MVRVLGEIGAVIISLVVGAGAGIGLYWYLVVHRGKINVPTGLSDITKK